MKSKTRKILGIPLRLVVGRRYHARRPMGLLGAYLRCFPNGQSQNLWPVSIISCDHRKPWHFQDVGLMTREHADRFLAAFNNGKSSFEGRVWR